LSLSLSSTGSLISSETPDQKLQYVISSHEDTVAMLRCGGFQYSNNIWILGQEGLRILIHCKEAETLSFQTTLWFGGTKLECSPRRYLYDAWQEVSIQVRSLPHWLELANKIATEVGISFRPAISRSEAAIALVQAHMQGDTSITKAFYKEITLGTYPEFAILEVNDDLWYTGDVLAFRLAKSAECPYHAMLLSVCQKEWEEVLAGTLPLPIVCGSIAGFSEIKVDRSLETETSL
jgi:hypothetical protein